MGPAPFIHQPEAQSLSAIVAKSPIMERDGIKMVQVRTETHERLTALKVPGLTYDDVINLGLDSLTPEAIAKHYAEWQKEAMRRLSAASKPIQRRRIVGAKA